MPGKTSCTFQMIWLMPNVEMMRGKGVFCLHEPGIVLEEVWKALTKPGGKQQIFSFSSQSSFSKNWNYLEDQSSQECDTSDTWVVSHKTWWETPDCQFGMFIAQNPCKI